VVQVWGEDLGVGQMQWRHTCLHMRGDVGRRGVVQLGVEEDWIRGWECGWVCMSVHACVLAFVCVCVC
jgi:hypothetical protein